MSTDPVQQLIDAGAISANPFAATSRYSGVPLGLYTRKPGERGVPYVLRRFIPQPREIAIAAEHIVQGGERPDLLAALLLGDPEMFWRLADVNRVIDPFELCDTPGARVLIPLPPGF
jgi:hypothetical protein